MQAFVKHTGIVAPLLLDNVDTDQIIPSREMRSVGRDGLAAGLFANWRYRTADFEHRELQPEFILNRPEFAGATILLGGKNFGCGSSREHAVWALCEFGIRAIIAESFGRIFRRNCAHNGLLAITLSATEIAAIQTATGAAPQDDRLTIDLETCEMCLPGGIVTLFSIQAADRTMLLSGLDPIDMTLQQQASLDRFDAADRRLRPWAYLP